MRKHVHEDGAYLYFHEVFWMLSTKMKAFYMLVEKKTLMQMKRTS